MTLASEGPVAAEAEHALSLGFEAAAELVNVYMKQVFQIRHLRQARLDTGLACRLAPGFIGSGQEAAYGASFNTIAVPFTWADIESEEEVYHWEPYDNLVNWAAKSGLSLVGGPLVDFSGHGMPCWLWEKGNDLTSRCGYVTDFVEKVVERDRGVIRTWHVTAASNWAGVIALADDELLWLTVRVAEVVRRMDPTLEVIIGVAQPWGDYLTSQERSQSPFIFADNLMRTGLKVSALDLEIVMAVSPRGSYCRDLLDVSRLLDLYALLGIPLQITLGYPSGKLADAHADADQKVAAGFWRSGYSPEVQADWAADFARLCVCKQYVRAVHWTHFADSQPHHFPHCGLVDASGNPKPALNAMTALRAEHLR